MQHSTGASGAVQEAAAHLAKDVVEHLLGQAPRLRILLTWMVAANHRRLLGAESDDRTVPKARAWSADVRTARD